MTQEIHGDRLSSDPAQLLRDLEIQEDKKMGDSFLMDFPLAYDIDLSSSTPNTVFCSRRQEDGILSWMGSCVTRSRDLETSRPRFRSTRDLEKQGDKEMGDPFLMDFPLAYDFDLSAPTPNTVFCTRRQGAAG